jgi:RNA polymerase sigma-70 factor (ECF subfamily)
MASGAQWIATAEGDALWSQLAAVAEASLDLDDEDKCDTRRLVLAAKSGDRTALAELYRKYYSVAISVAVCNGAIGEADDLVHDAFLKAFEKLDQLREPEKFGGWLCKITRNIAVRRPNIRVVLDDVTIARQSSAEGQTTALEVSRVLEAIQRLRDHKTREVVYMRFVQGMTGPEISSRTNMTPLAVRQRLHRGIKELRTQLEGSP